MSACSAPSPLGVGEGHARTSCECSASDVAEALRRLPSPTRARGQRARLGDAIGGAVDACGAASGKEPGAHRDEAAARDESLGRGDFRSKYIAKIVGSGGGLPQRAPAHQTVFIFDWDDTLLCTSWLIARSSASWLGARHWRPDAKTAAHLACIEQFAANLLKKALSVGRAVIVTNAGSSWVETSARRWAPGLLPLLQNMQVVSARDIYQGRHPKEGQRWKIAAFLGLQHTIPDKLVTNLIAFGDSELEMTAAQVLRGQFEHAVLKAVKFLPTPSPLELLAQMEAVWRNLDRIVDRTDDVRIDLAKHRRAG